MILYHAISDLHLMKELYNRIYEPYINLWFKAWVFYIAISAIKVSTIKVFFCISVKMVQTWCAFLSLSTSQFASFDMLPLCIKPYSSVIEWGTVHSYLKMKEYHFQSMHSCVVKFGSLTLKSFDVT